VLEREADVIESVQQAMAAMLRDLGYRRAQGFLYAHPLPPEDFAARWRTSDAAALSTRSAA